ncbi:nucleoside recognition protein [Archaeoglobales archaeon]|nr:MAG: nucleoside recognition protein [Archaeoglobales archaeon]
MIEKILVQTLKFLIRTIPISALGVIFAEFIVNLGYVDRVSFIARPIVSFARLRKECGVSFVTAFISPTAANSMLVEYYKNKLIEKRELYISSIINSFPAIIMHWRYMLPVLIPLLGLTGLIYFLLLSLVGLLKTLIVMLIGRILLNESWDSEPNNLPMIKPTLKEVFEKSIKNAVSTIKKISITMTVTILIVNSLVTLGFFDLLAENLKTFSSYLPIESTGLAIIAAHFGGYVASCTVAADLMSRGLLNQKGIILSLLFAELITSIASVRYLMPYYIGIFGAEIGGKIMVMSIALRDAVLLLVIFLISSV